MLVQPGLCNELTEGPLVEFVKAGTLVVEWPVVEVCEDGIVMVGGKVLPLAAGSCNNNVDNVEDDEDEGMDDTTLKLLVLLNAFVTKEGAWPPLLMLVGGRDCSLLMLLLLLLSFVDRGLTGCIDERPAFFPLT